MQSVAELEKSDTFKNAYTYVSSVVRPTDTDDKVIYCMFDIPSVIKEKEDKLTQERAQEIIVLQEIMEKAKPAIDSKKQIGEEEKNIVTKTAELLGIINAEITEVRKRLATYQLDEGIDNDKRKTHEELKEIKSLLESLL